jgi:hypothetical protein
VSREEEERPRRPRHAALKCGWHRSVAEQPGGPREHKGHDAVLLTAHAVDEEQRVRRHAALAAHPCRRALVVQVDNDARHRHVQPVGGLERALPQKALGDLGAEEPAGALACAAVRRAARLRFGAAVGTQRASAQLALLVRCLRLHDPVAQNRLRDAPAVKAVASDDHHVRSVRIACQP